MEEVVLVTRRGIPLMSRVIINVPTGEADAREIANMIEGWIEPYLEEDLGWDEEQILDIQVEA